MKAPIEQFLKQALKDYETELQKHGNEARSHRYYRLRGAEQFAMFLLGKQPEKDWKVSK